VKNFKKMFSVLLFVLIGLMSTMTNAQTVTTNQEGVTTRQTSATNEPINFNLKDQKAWDNLDYVLLGSFVASSFSDWRQTRNIARNPNKYDETNFLLGKNPSIGEVNTHFVLGLAGVTAVSVMLSSDNRKIWLGTITAIKMLSVIHNRNVGVSFAF